MFKRISLTWQALLLLPTGIFGGQDVGWAGAFVPMIVGEGTLNELRNMAGPPQFPGQKMITVNLETGAFKWMTRSGKGRGRR